MLYNIRKNLHVKIVLNFRKMEDKDGFRRLERANLGLIF